MKRWGTHLDLRTPSALRAPGPLAGPWALASTLGVILGVQIPLGEGSARIPVVRFLKFLWILKGRGNQEQIRKMSNLIDI